MDFKNCSAFFNALMCVCACVSRGESLNWLQCVRATSTHTAAVGGRGRCGRDKTGTLSWLNKVMR